MYCNLSTLVVIILKINLNKLRKKRMCCHILLLITLQLREVMCRYFLQSHQVPQVFSKLHSVYASPWAAILATSFCTLLMTGFNFYSLAEVPNITRNNEWSHKHEEKMDHPLGIMYHVNEIPQKYQH